MSPGPPPTWPLTPAGLTSCDAQLRGHRGPYTVGVSRQFHVTADNPALGNTYTHVRFDFTIAGTFLADITAFEYDAGGGTWLPMPLSQRRVRCDWILRPPGGFPLPAPYTATTTFRITFATAKTYPVSIQLKDLDDASRVLATLAATAVANPGVPVITLITDNDPCAQDGIHVAYTPGADAASHDLYRNGSLVVTGYASGALYNPGDTASHNYTIRAIKGASFTDSTHRRPLPTSTTPQHQVDECVVTNPTCSGAVITFTASPTPRLRALGGRIHEGFQLRFRRRVDASQ